MNCILVDDEEAARSRLRRMLAGRGKTFGRRPVGVNVRRAVARRLARAAGRRHVDAHRRPCTVNEVTTLSSSERRA